MRRAAVGAAEVVPLAAAAVVEDRLAAVGVAHRAKRVGDLGIAVSQSISSKVPSGRRRSGVVSRWRPFW